MTAALGYYAVGLVVAVFAVIVLTLLKAADIGIDRRFGMHLPDTGEEPPTRRGASDDDD